MPLKSFFLGVLGVFLAAVSLYYDAWWHVTFGRESFWILPHLILYLGVGMAALGFLLQGLTLWRKQFPVETPLKGWGWGVFFVLLSAPFDALWHQFFGIESVHTIQAVWSPPHLLLLGSMILISISLLILLLSRWVTARTSSFFLLVLVTFGAMDGFITFLLAPLSPLSVWAPTYFGVFIYYLAFVFLRMTALELFRRPVLTYIAIFHFLFLSFLFSTWMNEGNVEPYQVIILLSLGVLTALLGDGAFLILLKNRLKNIYPILGLFYMAVESLILGPFLNYFVYSGHFQIPIERQGMGPFNSVTIAIMILAGGMAGILAPLLGRYLRRKMIRNRQSEDKSRIEIIAAKSMSAYINIFVIFLILIFVPAFIKLKDPEILEAAQSRIQGGETEIHRIAPSLEFEKRRFWFYSFPSLWISQDDQHVAYKIYHREKKVIVITDGIEGPVYEGFISNGIARFSPDGKKLMYAAQQNGKWVLVVNSQESKAYADIYPSYTFSPDSQRTAFVAVEKKNNQENKVFVVIDGTESPAYDEIGFYPSHLKPDVYNGGSQFGRHLFYTMELDRWRFITDGWDRTLEAWSVGFSPDGRHYAYSAKRQGFWKVVIDGVEHGNYEGVIPLGGLDGHLFFSPDGQKIAYAAKREEKWFMVINGVEDPAYDFIEALLGGRFSSDSQHLAYRAFSHGKWKIVTDGVEGKEYQDVGPPQFTPKEQKVTYVAFENGKGFLVMDRAEGTRYPAEDIIAFPHLVFSSDDQRIAFAVPFKTRWRVAVDWKLSNEYHTVTDPRFSPDGRHYAYAAAINRRWRVVIDGQEGPIYDAIAGLRFLSDHEIIYIAIKGHSVLQVKHLIL
ncbi:MAG: PD40 domain-containing protein [Nitrospirae bacterium]|nr:PD40 domain-containing protein [Nitrospirota bacterium]